MLDVHLRLFCESLKRVLAGEEGTITSPDSSNLSPLFQNLLTESEVVISLLGKYEADMNLPLVLEIWDKELQDVERQDLLGILKGINHFVRESEKAIDTFFITIMQQQPNSPCTESESSTTCMELCHALRGLLSEIIDISHRIQQLPPSKIDFDMIITEITKDFIQTDHAEFSELESGREVLFDLLIEGQPQLLVVAIIDGSGFDKSAFAAEIYNNNHVKFYFDCHAWVRVSPYLDFERILDDIMKSVMPASSLNQILGKDYESKITILRDYLTNKKYFIVLDDVWDDDIWNYLEEVLPDYQNGSRVLIIVTISDILTSFELENGEIIKCDSVLSGGPLIRIKYERWQFFILHYGSKSLKDSAEESRLPLRSRLLSMLELPFHLKVCCLYLCLFPTGVDISTRQLFQLWIAEGFIPHSNEETAEEYLKELINSDFIQVNKRRAGGTIKSCYFASTFYATLIVLTEYIEFAIDRKDDEKKIVKRYCNFEKLTEFVSSEHSDTYLHSLLNYTSESDRPAIIDCMEICEKFKLLKVLNWGSLVLDEYPTGIENLFLLRYLKLSIPSLKSLPSSICNLLNLYTLDMPSSYIDDTPEEIWKMHKLMHLNFGCINLPAPPKNCSSSLKNLIFISALHPSSCTPDILGSLPNVQTLRISGDLSYYQFGVSKSLCELHKLECLKLVNESKLSGMVLSDYRFPPSLTQLSLSNTELKEDPMPTLEKLPHLQVLKLKQNSYLGRKLACVCPGGFPQLKVLHLKSMYWLEDWTMGAGTMPKLESLIVNPCAYLRKLPEELWCIKCFCKLDLHWPQPELRHKLRAFEDMEQRYDIKLYPYGI